MIEFENSILDLATKCIACSGREIRALAAQFERFSLGLSPEDFLNQVKDTTPRELALAKLMVAVIRVWEGIEDLPDEPANYKAAA